MQRALAFLLSVVFVIATAAIPAAVCVRTGIGMADSEHDCCGELPVPMTPAGSCCVVSQPMRDGVVVAATPLATKADHAAVAAVHHAAWMTSAGSAHHQGGTAPPIAHASSVPLYLQQLSLLI